jgi:hypothetical protein
MIPFINSFGFKIYLFLFPFVVKLYVFSSYTMGKIKNLIHKNMQVFNFLKRIVYLFPSLLKKKDPLYPEICYFASQILYIYILYRFKLSTNDLCIIVGNVGQMEGFHVWCEVNIKNRWWVIDPTFVQYKNVFFDVPIEDKIYMKLKNKENPIVEHRKAGSMNMDWELFRYYRPNFWHYLREIFTYYNTEIYKKRLFTIQLFTWDESKNSTTSQQHQIHTTNEIESKHPDMTMKTDYQFK